MLHLLLYNLFKIFIF